MDTCKLGTNTSMNVFSYNGRKVSSHMIDTPDKLCDLRKIVAEWAKSNVYVGLDTEGTPVKYINIALDDHVYIINIRSNDTEKSECMKRSPNLKHILYSNKVCKVGVDIATDNIRIHESLGYPINNIMDLQTYYQLKTGSMDYKSMSYLLEYYGLPGGHKKKRGNYFNIEYMTLDAYCSYALLRLISIGGKKTFPTIIDDEICDDDDEHYDLIEEDVVEDGKEVAESIREWYDYDHNYDKKGNNRSRDLQIYVYTKNGYCTLDEMTC